MGTSNVKRLQLIVLLSLATFVALGYSAVQKGIVELARFGQNSFSPNGPQTKQSRSLGDFDRIEAGGVYDVDVSFGSKPSVTLEAPRDLLNHLTTDVSGGTLKLGANIGYNIKNNGKIRAHVVTRHLRGANVSGASKMVINGKINEGSFYAEASGASSLRLSASVDKFSLDASGAAKTTISSLGAHSLKIEASGAAECMINGSANSTAIEASGASHIKGNLTSNSAAVQTSGAASANLRVLNSISGEADGASSITYSGHPSQVSVSHSGVASINRSN